MEWPDQASVQDSGIYAIELFKRRYNGASREGFHHDTPTSGFSD
jgi:hypothetical protein